MLIVLGQEKGPAKQGIPTEALTPCYQKPVTTGALLQPCEVQGPWNHNEDGLCPELSLSHTTQRKYALRTLLGGVWAKEETSETDTHSVQDDQNRGGFVWRCALSEMKAYL